MIVTVLKAGFVKRGPKIVTYRDYSKFSAVDFKDNLVHMVSSELSETEDYGAFEAGVMRLLNEHAPIKKNQFVQTMGRLFACSRYKTSQGSA